jgi:sodium-dependent dicarboxylate transporter 2/3/5
MLSRRDLTWMIISIVSAVGTVIVTGLSLDWPREASLMAGIVVLVAMFWLLEVTPLYVTSILAVLLQVLLIANPGQWSWLGFETPDRSLNWRDVVVTMADPVILLFFGGFVLARVLGNEQIDRLLAHRVLSRFALRGPAKLLAATMALGWFMSMWISNTAAAAMMIALIAPLRAVLGPKDGLQASLVLGIAFAANIGGMVTPIGSPPNAIALGALRDAGSTLSFGQWVAVGFPFSLVLLATAWWLLSRPLRHRRDRIELPPATGRLALRGKFVVAVFALTVLLWFAEPIHGLSSAVVALMPVVLFGLAGMLRRADINGLDWDILMLIAGGISLGVGIKATGLDRALVGPLLDAGVGFVAVAAMVALFALILGQFVSNTATATLLIPIGLSFARATDASGLEMAAMSMAIALAASSCMALPVATPPNAIAYAQGVVTQRQMALPGLVIGLLAWAILSAALMVVSRV